VVGRQGTSPEAALERTPELAGHVGTSIHLVHAATSDVSSSEIRARLASGQSVEGLVPPTVARHIEIHQLYRTIDEVHGQD
jgi:nicotinate-nucleotide adenylyltransferase